ncbi:MAG: MBL fold metallo-hydrolase [Treponema sp.]|jgi:glyoxylase-like metal-dependent hydrolase (beta-lactamase superfamily II)|nr:MBL fold metallo-hydrolase [Treponema sp.]
MNNFIPKPLVVGEIATNCWIVPLEDETPIKRGSKNCAVIDPGDEAPVIVAHLRDLNLYPKYILLTHGHFDHLAALPDLLAAYTAGAAEEDPVIAIHRDDAAYLGPEAYKVHCHSFAAASGDHSYIDSLWKLLPAPDRLLAEGDAIGPFTVLNTPGHTPGSVCFFWEQRKLLFSGDTLFQAGEGRTDLPGGDYQAIEKSIRRLVAMDSGIGVFPGHGDSTTIGAEQRYYR